MKYGFKPMPASLKIVFVLLCFWIVMSASRLRMFLNDGGVIFGAEVTGIAMFLFALIFDILFPIVLLRGLWIRAPWCGHFAIYYMGLFILHILFSIPTLIGEFGIGPLLFPIVLEGVMLALVLVNRTYLQWTK